MKTALLISCFEEWYRDRLEPICEILKDKGVKTIYAVSDYNRIKKKYSERNNKKCEYIHVPSYKKTYQSEEYGHICHLVTKLISL